MSETPNDLTAADALRMGAEKRLVEVAPDIATMPAENLQRLVHELQVHQIELETQNEELRRSQQELRRSQQELALAHDRYVHLYDFAPVGYLTLSEKGLILEANLTAAKMLGVERARLINRRLSSFVVPEDEDILYAQRYELLETQERQTCELRLRRADAELLWANMECVIMGDAEDDELRIGYVISDIAARRSAHDERLLLERQIQHVQKLESLGILAGGIAHDFNNLLTGILGNASLALMELSPISPVRECIEQIETTSERAAELCKQMLAYSGRGRFVIEGLDLSGLVGEMASLLKHSISKNAALDLQLADGLPAVAADAAQIRQVVMNLIINASEALGDEEGVITVSTRAMECSRSVSGQVHPEGEPPEGGRVCLEVTDTGCGIDSETRAKIFDPFFTTKFTGRGLGLSAVLGIVRGHSGTVALTSEPGGGATFRVMFPASDLPLEVEAPKASAAAGQRSSETILVVDDEEVVRRLVRRILESSGWRVITAVDGREAVEIFKLRGHEINLVLLDLTMPRMAGEEAFRELRKIRDDVRIVLSSGFSEQDAIERFRGLDLAGFVQKPYRPAELTAALGEALDQR